MTILYFWVPCKEGFVDILSYCWIITFNFAFCMRLRSPRRSSSTQRCLAERKSVAQCPIAKKKGRKRSITKLLLIDRIWTDLLPRILVYINLLIGVIHAIIEIRPSIISSNNIGKSKVLICWKIQSGSKSQYWKGLRKKTAQVSLAKYLKWTVLGMIPSNTFFLLTDL